jgi:hypothetical protein
MNSIYCISYYCWVFSPEILMNSGDVYISSKQWFMFPVATVGRDLKSYEWYDRVI